MPHDKRVFRFVGLAALLLLATLALSIPSAPALAADSCTLAVTASGGVLTVGETGGVQRRAGQTFIVNSSGTLTEFRLRQSSNTGSPTGPIYWEFRGASLTGSVLASGSFTSSPSNDISIMVSGGPFLAAGSTYALTFYADSQSSGNAYRVQTSTTSVYADGVGALSSNAGSSWTNQTFDMQFSVITNGLCSTPTPTAFSSSTPTTTPTPTLTPTPDFWVIATLPTQAYNYPIAIKPTADFGDMSLFAIGVVTAGMGLLILIVKVRWDRNVGTDA